MNKVDELLIRYTEVFNDNFPIFAVRTMPETDLIKLLEACIENGKPYKPVYNQNAEY
ncbi:hypothetical protein AGMMS49579_09170 [Spirochaetia bacterium]|nr:hypothetical protein AGMMS49579_09170 [Spirochaetia bacterium]